MEQPAGRASPAPPEPGGEKGQSRHGRPLEVWLATEIGSLDPLHEMTLVGRAYLALTNPGLR